MTSLSKKENMTAASSAMVAASDESRDEGGFLILETNYRVYAYTGWLTARCCKPGRDTAANF